MIRQILTGAAIALAVGAGTQQCAKPADGAAVHPTMNAIAPPATETKPWCTPASSKLDSWLNNCHMPPAPPEGQSQPAWALERDGDIDPQQPDARTVICAQPIGTGASQYWPHDHATRVWADQQCQR